jgi:hypothetical protein
MIKERFIFLSGVSINYILAELSWILTLISIYTNQEKKKGNSP